MILTPPHSALTLSLSLVSHWMSTMMWSEGCSSVLLSGTPSTTRSCNRAQGSILELAMNLHSAQRRAFSLLLEVSTSTFTSANKDIMQNCRLRTLAGQHRSFSGHYKTQRKFVCIFKILSLVYVYSIYLVRLVVSGFVLKGL